MFIIMDYIYVFNVIYEIFNWWNISLELFNIMI